MLPLTMHSNLAPALALLLNLAPALPLTMALNIAPSLPLCNVHAPRARCLSTFALPLPMPLNLAPALPQPFNPTSTFFFPASENHPHW